MKEGDLLRLDLLSDRDLGKAFLNVYYYRKSRSELADPSLIELVLDIESAIKDVKLTKRERDILRVHYDVVGGDAIAGDFEDKQQMTANILGLHRNTISNNLNSVWTRIGRSYRGERI